MRVSDILLFLSVLVPLMTSLREASAQPLKFPWIDQYGKLLPVGARQRLGDPRELRHSVNSIAIAPDGRLVVLAYDDGFIDLWSLPHAQHVRRLQGHQGGVKAVAISPDGSELASAGDDGTVRLWDTVLGREKCQFMGHSKRVAAVSFSPDGKVLASGGWDQKVYLWDCGTGKKLRERNFSAEVNAVAFSADGRILAAGTNSNGVQDPIRAWDVATDTERFCFGHEHRSVNAIAFSPDGRTLASANDYDTIELLEVATGRLIRTFYGHHGYVKCVAFSPDGRTLASSASGGTDLGIRLWEVASGQMYRQFRNPAYFTIAVAFTPDGQTLISGGRDGAALIWPLDRKEAHPKYLASASFSELGAMWQTLREPDAPQAQAAIWAMISRREAAVDWIKGNVKAAAPITDRHIDDLIDQLDNRQYQVRQKATAELHQIGHLAAPAIAKVMAGNPSLETLRRLENIRQRMKMEILSGETLQAYRAVEVLERIGTLEAQQVLEILASGATGSVVTQQAHDALVRLKRKQPEVSRAAS